MTGEWARTCVRLMVDHVPVSFPQHDWHIECYSKTVTAQEKEAYDGHSLALSLTPGWHCLSFLLSASQFPDEAFFKRWKVRQAISVSNGLSSHLLSHD